MLYRQTLLSQKTNRRIQSQNPIDSIGNSSGLLPRDTDNPRDPDIDIDDDDTDDDNDNGPKPSTHKPVLLNQNATQSQSQEEDTILGLKLWIFLTILGGTLLLLLAVGVVIWKLRHVQTEVAVQSYEEFKDDEVQFVDIRL